ADTAHAGEDPSLRDAAGFECVRNGAHHRILADQVIEGRWAVLACEHAVGRSARRPIARHQTGPGLLGAVAHNAIPSARSTPSLRVSHGEKGGRLTSDPTRAR